MAQISSDIEWLHRRWMSLLFPHQLEPHPVLGYYEPDTVWKRVGYMIWGVLGKILSLAVYPLVLIGYLLQQTVHKISITAHSLGIGQTLLFFALVWSGLASSILYVEGNQNGIAVAVAGVVALGATILAFAAQRTGTRSRTVLIAYPAAYTALFLPPITAAVLSPLIGDAVLHYSILFAELLLSTVGAEIGVSEWFRNSFELTGHYHIIMWFSVATIIGWLTGVAVTLADVLRTVELSDETSQ